jgi:Asp-tRNA(Asn)/Glu-tRNA(Gln) amidotransferase B subunit
MAFSRAQTNAVLLRLVLSNPDKWREAKQDEKLREWFIAQTIRQTQGKAERDVIRSLLIEKLDHSRWSDEELNALRATGRTVVTD